MKKIIFLLCLFLFYSCNSQFPFTETLYELGIDFDEFNEIRFSGEYERINPFEINGSIWFSEVYYLDGVEVNLTPYYKEYDEFSDEDDYVEHTLTYDYLYLTDGKIMVYMIEVIKDEGSETGSFELYLNDNFPDKRYDILEHYPKFDGEYQVSDNGVLYMVIDDEIPRKAYKNEGELIMIGKDEYSIMSTYHNLFIEDLNNAFEHQY